MLSRLPVLSGVLHQVHGKANGGLLFRGRQAKGEKRWFHVGSREAAEEVAPQPMLNAIAPARAEPSPAQP
jgi:hypothetical protein